MFFRRKASLRRRALDALIALVSVGVAAAIVMAIDSRSGEQLERLAHKGAANGGVVTQFGADITHVARSAWDLSYVYGPLMTFGAVAVVLLVAMTRSK